jgi:hypothetical protein
MRKITAELAGQDEHREIPTEGLPEYFWVLIVEPSVRFEIHRWSFNDLFNRLRSYHHGSKCNVVGIYANQEDAEAEAEAITNAGWENYHPDPWSTNMKIVGLPDDFWYVEDNRSNERTEAPATFLVGVSILKALLCTYGWNPNLIVGFYADEEAARAEAHRLSEEHRLAEEQRLAEVQRWAEAQRLAALLPNPNKETETAGVRATATTTGGTMKQNPKKENKESRWDLIKGLLGLAVLINGCCVGRAYISDLNRHHFTDQQMRQLVPGITDAELSTLRQKEQDERPWPFGKRFPYDGSIPGKGWLKDAL